MRYRYGRGWGGGLCVFHRDPLGVGGGGGEKIIPLSRTCVLSSTALPKDSRSLCPLPLRCRRRKESPGSSTLSAPFETCSTNNNRPPQTKEYRHTRSTQRRTHRDKHINKHISGTQHAMAVASQTDEILKLSSASLSLFSHLCPPRVLVRRGPQ